MITENAYESVFKAISSLRRNVKKVLIGIEKATGEAFLGEIMVNIKTQRQAKDINSQK